MNLYSAKSIGEYSKTLYIQLKNYAYTYSKKIVTFLFYFAGTVWRPVCTQCCYGNNVAEVLPFHLLS